MITVKVGSALKGARFDLGVVVATDNAVDALQGEGMTALALLGRHISCDWSEMQPEDAEWNEKALADGGKILSAYELPETRETIWVVTESDRSVTTILLPYEY